MRRASHVSGQAMEQENDRRVDALSGKVGAMRHLALQISDEVQSQNRYLESEMGGGFERANAVLRKTARRLDEMVQSSGGRHMWALAGGVLLLLLLLYLLFPR